MIRLRIRKKGRAHRGAIWRGEQGSEWHHYKPRNAKAEQQPPESRREVGNGFSATGSVAVCSSSSRRGQPVRCCASGPLLVTCGRMNRQTAPGRAPQLPGSKPINPHSHLHWNMGVCIFPRGRWPPTEASASGPSASIAAWKYPIKPGVSTSQGSWEICPNDKAVLLVGKGLLSSDREYIFNHSRITMKRQTLLACVHRERNKTKQNTRKMLPLGTTRDSLGFEPPRISAAAAKRNSIFLTSWYIFMSAALR